jgi:hypothetical protein
MDNESLLVVANVRITTGQSLVLEAYFAGA